MQVEHDPFEFHNVEMILTNDENKWKEQVEVELATPLDIENGPMWRVKVIQMNGDEHKYTFVFLFNHVCTDGKNNVIFIELLDIIGALLENKMCGEMVQVVDSPAGLSTYQKEYISRDTYVKPTDLYEYDSQHRMLPDTLGSDNHHSGKVEYIKFEHETMKKLIAKMKLKTNGVAKINGLFEAIYYCVYKKLLLKHGEVELSKTPIQYIISCGGRDKLKINYSQMGLYNFSLFRSLVADVADTESIWQLAAKLTKSLHERLKRDEEIESYSSFDELMSGSKVLSVDDLSTPPEKSLQVGFGISNIGILGNTASTIIKATELYCAVPSKHSFVRITTVNNTLCLTISYSQKTFSTSIANELTQSLIDIVTQLCD